MAKFFLPLILLLLTAWIIVGVQQEYEKNSLYNPVTYDSLIKIAQSEYYIDSLKLEKYKDFKLITYKGIAYLIPNSFYESSLTTEEDAIFQFERYLPPLKFILYSDLKSTDSTAYNFSLDNYIVSTINANKNNASWFKMEDSLVFNLGTGQKAVMTSYIRTKTYEDGTSNTLHISFLATADTASLYMLFFYCDTADYSKNIEDIHKIYTSTGIFN
ncbi:MAG: hypothetical protein HPY79_00500 [Bacteroidales bacterium]|nr:hypothetical protein [Bacteroidales bacterium]